MPEVLRERARRTFQSSTCVLTVLARRAGLK